MNFTGNFPDVSKNVFKSFQEYHGVGKELKITGKISKVFKIFLKVYKNTHGKEPNFTGKFHIYFKCFQV